MTIQIAKYPGAAHVEPLFLKLVFTTPFGAILFAMFGIRTLLASP